jgi:16S rRNA (cytosine967-C5)-methyltransferase
MAIEVARGRLKLSSGELRALVEAIRKAEYIKPSQSAKRLVFREYGIAGSPRDELLTAVFYSVMKKMGVIDRVIARSLGFENPSDVLALDPWLRSALRIAVELVKFRDLDPETARELKWKVADFVSKKTHPYVGMFYWRAYDKIRKTSLTPSSEEEKLEFELLIPYWLVKRLLDVLGDKEGLELLKSLNYKLPLSVRVNTLKADVPRVLRELEKDGVRPVVSPRVPTIIKFDGPYNFDRSRLLRKGWIVVQEEAAAYASIALSPRPGETVVDLAAAPGGKTQHMAELMRNKGVIHAFDIYSARSRVSAAFLYHFFRFREF